MSDVINATERMDLGPCVICGRSAYSVYEGNAIRLKDNSPLCDHCVRRLRFLYPVSQEFSHGEVRRIDPLADLTAEEVIHVIGEAGEKLEDLREQYAPWNAVFRIDSCSTEKQGLFKSPKIFVTGYVLFGKFNLGDSVTLLQDGREIEITIQELDSNVAGGEPGAAGYENTLHVAQKGLVFRSGSLLVKA